MAGEIGRIGVIGIEAVFLDPRQPLAGPVTQPHLRWLAGGGTGDDQALTGIIHHRFVPAAGRGQALRFGAGLAEIERIDLFFQRGIGKAGEPQAPALFINAHQFIHHPAPAGQLLRCAAGEAIEVAIAVALAGPQDAAVLQRAEIVMNIDPGLCGLAGQHPRRTGDRINGKDIEPLLIAGEALDIQRLAIHGPGDTGDIDIGRRAKIDLGLARSIRVHQPQRYIGIGGASRRIGLGEQAGAIGTDGGARHLLHRGFVDARHGDAAVVRCPPVTVEPVQLFLRDELGNAPAHLRRVFPGHFARVAAGQGLHEQMAVAHEAGKAALGAQLGICLGFRCLGQARDAAIEGGHPQIAVHRHQQAFRIGCPGIIGDALDVGNAPAFAVHALGFGQRSATGQLFRIDQHPALTGRGVHRPQVESVLVAGPAFQQRRQPAIGGQFQYTRARAAQRR